MDIQSNDLVQELRKEIFQIKSKHNHSNEWDNQLDNQCNELKKYNQELKGEYFQFISKLKNLPCFNWDCFEQLGLKLYHFQFYFIKPNNQIHVSSKQFHMVETQFHSCGIFFTLMKNFSIPTMFHFI